MLRIFKNSISQKKNDNTIHPIFVSEAVISRNTPVFVMEETREEKKKTTIPTFVVTFWLDSDKRKKNPGCRFPETEHNTTESILLRSRSAHRATPAKAYIPHHLLICLSSLLLLFCSSFWWCCSLSPPPPSSFPSERRWYDSECKSSGVWLGRPFYIRVRVGMFYFVLLLPPFMLLFFLSKFLGRAHNTFIYSLIITHANSAGSYIRWG